MSGVGDATRISVLCVGNGGCIDDGPAFDVDADRVPDVSAAVDRIDDTDVDCVVVGGDVDADAVSRLVADREEVALIASVDDHLPDDLVGVVDDVVTDAEASVTPEVVRYRILRALDDARRTRERTLRRRERQLETFASVVSHDLRNPMHVARGHLDLARETGDDDHLESVEGALDRMERIVDEMLALVRGGSGAVDREPVRLERVVQRAWDTVDTADATLVAGTDAVVLGDEALLAQVFENLFRNAVDHGPEDVTVRVGVLDDTVFVEDDGPGIQPEERDRVFELGYTTADSGTGLGLAIVRRLVTAHDWDLTVDAGVDGGAQFRISGVDRC